MKFCTHCGKEVLDEAELCVGCGCRIKKDVPAVVPQEKDDTMSVVVKIFMIMGCIAQGWLLIPLAWCIPMTVSVFKSLNEGRPIGTGMKVCVLLFVNLIAGVCLLCMNDEPANQPVVK